MDNAGANTEIEVWQKEAQGGKKEEEAHIHPNHIPNPVPQKVNADTTPTDATKAMLSVLFPKLVRAHAFPSGNPSDFFSFRVDCEIPVPKTNGAVTR